jgi:hypothetical protein
MEDTIFNGHFYPKESFFSSIADFDNFKNHKNNETCNIQDAY